MIVAQRTSIMIQTYIYNCCAHRVCAHYRPHCHTLPRALPPHIAAHTATHAGRSMFIIIITATNPLPECCHPPLPHTAARIHCRTLPHALLPHTVAHCRKMPHSRTQPRALPYLYTRPSALPYTAARTARAHCRAHGHKLPLALLPPHSASCTAAQCRTYS